MSARSSPGFYAPAEAASSCLACRSTQLCPVATAEPVEVVDFRAVIAQSISEAFGGTASSQTSALALGLGRARARVRRLLQQGFFAALTATDVDTRVSYRTESVRLDTNSANVTRAEIKVEGPATRRLNYALAALVVGVGALLVLVGAAVFFYVKFPSKSKSEAVMQQRRSRVRKLDVLYRDFISERRKVLAEEIEEEEAARRQRQLHAQLGAPSSRSSTDIYGCGSGSGSSGIARAASEDHDSELDSAPEQTSTTRSRSVVGSVFALLGLALAAVAVGYVVLQYAIANYQIVQSLSAGSSPSAGDIHGAFELSVSFIGFAGALLARIKVASNSASTRNATAGGRAGVYVLTSGVGPEEDGAPPGPAPVAEARYNASQRSCLVTWRCEDCRLAATEAAVEFRLVARLAFAVATSYLIRVPNHVTVEGLVTPRAVAQFTVFRGVRPVTDKRDGSPRYDVALRPADNRAAERSDASFNLCSMTRPLSDAECAGEAVGFRLAMAVDEVFLRVSRVERASLLDTIADVLSLAEFAVQTWKRWLARVPEGGEPYEAEADSGPRSPLNINAVGVANSKDAPEGKRSWSPAAAAGFVCVHASHGHSRPTWPPAPLLESVVVLELGSRSSRDGGSSSLDRTRSRSADSLLPLRAPAPAPSRALAAAAFASFASQPSSPIKTVLVSVPPKPVDIFIRRPSKVSPFVP
eukprot:tig00020660_g12571.t1